MNITVHLLKSQAKSSKNITLFLLNHKWQFIFILLFFLRDFNLRSSS